MATVNALDELFSADAGWLTPQAAEKLINWRLSDECRGRIEELGRKANLGLLTDEEAAEYRDYLDDAEIISLLQTKARRLYPVNG